MSSFLMGYHHGHPHFQGPIGGGPAIDPKFPPTDDFLYHHHHHMHLNHHHSSHSPLHNGYASNHSAGGGGGGVISGASNPNVHPMAAAANLQPSPVDYYGNSANYNYNPSNTYYNQQQQAQAQAAHLPPANVSPHHNHNNSSSNNSNNNINSTNNSSIVQQSANLDAYANITEMASVPSTQGPGSAGSQSGLNSHTMHPYSAATAAVTNASVNSTGGGGGAGAGLVGSYYGGYYGGTAPHHHSVLDLPIQCPHVEPTNTALGLQELGKFTEKSRRVVKLHTLTWSKFVQAFDWSGE